MFCTDIFFLILTFMSYNYHFEGQNYNLSEFGRYVSQSQVVRSPLQAGQSWSRRAVRSSGRPVAASRKIDVLVQVVAKASASDRQEVGTLLSGGECDQFCSTGEYVQNPPNGQQSTLQCQSPLSGLPFPPLVEIPAASNLHMARRQGENTRRKCKSFGSINIFSIIMPDENM